MWGEMYCIVCGVFVIVSGFLWLCGGGSGGGVRCVDVGGGGVCVCVVCGVCVRVRVCVVCGGGGGGGCVWEVGVRLKARMTGELCVCLGVLLG